MSRLVQVFAKLPTPGYCKTRLIPAIGAQRAARWHAGQVRRVATEACSVAETELWLASAYPGALRGQALVRQLCIPGRHACQVRRQLGMDLGARMHLAIRRGLSRARSVVLVGTDAPELDRAYLDEAFARLQSGADVVFGPTLDGGYCLIGCRRVVPGLFRAMPWGQAKVLSRSRRRLLGTELAFSELAVLRDIDTPGDWFGRGG